MNDTTLTQLRILVERAVRPVRASTHRTTHMRKELLAHVCAVFDEEVARLGDEYAALEQTRLRFGNPAELTAQLQATVSRSDGIARVIGDIMRFRPAEPVVRRALRHALLMPLLLAVQVPIVLVPINCVLGKWGPWPTQAFFFVALLLASSALAFLFTLSANGARQSLFERTPPAWAKGILLAAVAAFFIPGVTFAACLATSGDAATSFVDASGTLYLFPLIPLLIIGIGKLTADEVRWNAEWADLPIDPQKGASA